MNPFLSALIFAPLLFTLMVSAGSLYLLFTVGPRKDIVASFVLGTVFCSYLIYLFWKTLSPKGSLVDIPAVENISEEVRKSLTNQDIFVAYLALGIAGALFIGYEAIKGLPGLFAFLLGVFLLWSAIIILRAETPITRSVDYKLTRAALPRKKKVYFLLIGVIGLAIFLSHRYIPSWQFISIWDIYGALFFLVSTCVWLALVERKQKKDEEEVPKKRDVTLKTQKLS